MDDDPGCVVMLASAVSSKMLQAMAQVCSPWQPPQPEALMPSSCSGAMVVAC